MVHCSLNQLNQPQFEGILLTRNAIEQELDGDCATVLRQIKEKHCPVVDDHFGGLIGFIEDAYMNKKGDLIVQGRIHNELILRERYKPLCDKLRNGVYKDLSIGLIIDRRTRNVQVIEASVTEQGHFKGTNILKLLHFSAKAMSNASATDSVPATSTPAAAPSAAKDAPASQDAVASPGPAGDGASAGASTESERAFAALPESARALIQQVITKSQGSELRLKELEKHYEQVQRKRFESAQSDLKGTSLEKDKAFIENMEKHAMSLDSQNHFEYDLQRIQDAKTMREKDAELAALRERYEQQQAAIQAGPDPLFVRASAAAQTQGNVAAKHPWGNLSDLVQRENKRQRCSVESEDSNLVHRLQKLVDPPYLVQYNSKKAQTEQTVMQKPGNKEFMDFLTAYIRQDPTRQERESHLLANRDETVHVHRLSGQRNHNLPRHY